MWLRWKSSLTKSSIESWKEISCENLISLLDVYALTIEANFLFSCSMHTNWPTWSARISARTSRRNSATACSSFSELHLLKISGDSFWSPFRNRTTNQICHWCSFCFLVFPVWFQRTTQTSRLVALPATLIQNSDLSSSFCANWNKFHVISVTHWNNRARLIKKAKSFFSLLFPCVDAI